ncbi:MAG TPA: mechanosensitive ion channel protein MscS, partial [Silvibacterium sp.]|nr:mechanosensitive ion channel protein MscS [Silvibacterium sp.]
MSLLKQRRESRLHFGSQKTIVDLSPWQTAQALAALAVSAEERQYAHEAERLADHEVDQAFASALRQASMQRPVLSTEARAISERISQLGETVKADQVRVDSLSAAAGKSQQPPAANQGDTTSGSDDLDVAKAQLSLDQDELADARQELVRATGDQRPKIQQELAAHQAAINKYQAQNRDMGQVAVISSGQYGTLAARVRAYLAQDNRYKLIQQAIRDTQAEIANLTAQLNVAQ